MTLRRAVPKVLKTVSGISLIPGGSIYLSTNGYKDLAPLGLVLTRSQISPVAFNSAAQKGYYQTMGWSAPKVDTFVAQLQNPARAVFTRDLRDRDVLRLFKPAGCFGTNSPSTALTDSVSGVPVGLPIIYGERLRDLCHKVDAHWGATYRAATLANRLAFHGETLNAIGADLIADGWVNVSEQVYTDWRANVFYTVPTTGNITSSGVMPDYGGTCYAVVAGEVSVNATTMNPATSDVNDLHTSSATLFRSLGAVATKDLQYVYMAFQGCVYTGNPSTTMLFSIFKRRRRADDGDVLAYAVQCGSQQTNWNSGIQAVQTDRILLVTATRNPAAIPNVVAHQSRSTTAALMSGPFQYLPYAGPLPSGVLAASVPNGAWSEPFYVYGWPAFFDYLDILVDHSKTIVEPTTDSLSHVHLTEMGRKGVIRTSVVKDLLNARAEGLPYADRIAAQAQVATISSVEVPTIAFIHSKGEVDTSLASIVVHDPFASISDDPSDWAELTYTTTVDGVDVQKTYDELRGSIALMGVTMSMPPNLSKGSATAEPVVATYDSGTGITTYTIAGVASTMADCIAAICQGAPWSLVGSGATFASAFGAVDDVALRAKYLADRVHRRAFGQHNWREIPNDDAERAALAYYHVIERKEQTARMIGSLDFYSFRNLIKNA